MSDNGQLKSPIIYGQISMFPFPYPPAAGAGGEGRKLMVDSDIPRQSL